MTKRDERDPQRDLLQVQQRMNNLFETALARTDFDAPEAIDSWTPVCDAFETDAGLVLHLELPGLRQDQIELRIDGDELVVDGKREMERGSSGEQFHRVERSYGKFSRRFALPSTVERSAVQASFHDGVLQVKLPTRAGQRPESMRVDIS